MYNKLLHRRKVADSYSPLRSHRTLSIGLVPAQIHEEELCRDRLCWEFRCKIARELTVYRGWVARDRLERMLNKTTHPS